MSCSAAMNPLANKNAANTDWSLTFKTAALSTAIDIKQNIEMLETIQVETLFSQEVCIS